MQQILYLRVDILRMATIAAPHTSVNSYPQDRHTTNHFSLKVDLHSTTGDTVRCSDPPHCSVTRICGPASSAAASTPRHTLCYVRTVAVDGWPGRTQRPTKSCLRSSPEACDKLQFSCTTCLLRLRHHFARGADTCCASRRGSTSSGPSSPESVGTHLRSSCLSCADKEPVNQCWAALCIGAP